MILCATLFVLMIAFVFVGLFFNVSWSKMYAIRVNDSQFNNETYRDNVYLWVKVNSTDCIHVIDKGEKYEVLCASGNVYGMKNALLYWNVSNKAVRDVYVTKMKNVKSNSKTLHLDIDVFPSHNDGVPGQCTPDTEMEHIIK